MAHLRPLLAVLAIALVVPSAASAQGQQRYVDPLFPDVDVTRDVTYGAAINNFGELQSLELDIYRPVGDTATNRPAIIWAHGGGFKNGTKGAANGQMRYFASLGYVGIGIEYRLRPPGTPGSMSNPELVAAALTGEPEMILNAQHDMQAAIRWVRSHVGELGVDPDTLITAGGSAGAITALEAAFNPEDPGDSGNPGIPSDVQGVIALAGASDTRRIEPGAPPIIMFNGTSDVTVPFPLAVQTCLGTIALTNVCEPTIYPNEGHDAANNHTEEVRAKSVDFLCRQVVADC